MARLGHSVYFHCTAGKDRTGIAAMLILFALGSDKEVVLEDYLKTNECIDEILKKVIQGYGEERVRAIDETLGRVMLGVDATYLESAINTINDKYFGIDAYLKNQLKLTDNERKQLVEKYTE